MEERRRAEPRGGLKRCLACRCGGTHACTLAERMAAHRLHLALLLLLPQRRRKHSCRSSEREREEQEQESRLAAGVTLRKRPPRSMPITAAEASGAVRHAAVASSSLLACMSTSWE